MNATTRKLTTALAAEDLAEAIGILPADNRSTCHPCGTWATQEHLDSDAHWATVDAGTRRVTRAQLAKVACHVPDPDGIDGCCWRPRPCPDHDPAPTDLPRADLVLRYDHRIRLASWRPEKTDPAIDQTRASNELANQLNPLGRNS